MFSFLKGNAMKKIEGEISDIESVVVFYFNNRNNNKKYSEFTLNTFPFLLTYGILRDIFTIYLLNIS